MVDLPPDVLDRYRQLALHRHRRPETLAAMLKSAAWYQALDESDAERDYFEWIDEEGLEELGKRRLWETLLVDGQVIAVKQIEIPIGGEARRYCWQHLDDDASFLTDQSMNPEEEPITRITRQEFYQLWGDSPP
jgi:hypothetical protein